MKDLSNNSLVKILFVSSLIMLMMMFIHFNKPRTSKSIQHHVNTLSAKHLDINYLSPIELQYPLTEKPFVNSQLNDKHISKKGVLLREILRNKQKREKFEYVVEKAKELKLPVELALIPIIESQYNPKAVSNRGASGIWQLMPRTGRIFGLHSNQRFDMKLSTRAALLHLKDLYNEFGHWELAIAAYNAGGGRVSKALRKNTHATTIKGLKLPRETRNYVLSFNQLKTEVKKYKVANDILSGTA